MTQMQAIGVLFALAIFGYALRDLGKRWPWLLAAIITAWVALSSLALQTASMGKPTGQQIDDALKRLDQIRSTKLVDTYDCAKGEALVDARVFREMSLAGKVGLGGTLMEACEQLPQSGTFTLKDHRDGRIVMTFANGAYDIQ